MVESDNRMRVVIYYAVWATICAALAGIAVALVHTWFFSYHVGRSGFRLDVTDQGLQEARPPHVVAEEPGVHQRDGDARQGRADRCPDGVIDHASHSIIRLDHPVSLRH